MLKFTRAKKISSIIVLLLLGNYKYCAAQFGNDITFNGSTQFITTPNGMMNGYTVFTIEFRIKTTESRSNGTYWQCPAMIASVSDGGTSGDFGITTNNGYIGMWSGLNSNGDNAFLSASTQINDNNWHHIAAVNNGSIITLYVDGVSQGTISSGLGLYTANAPLTIAAASLNFGWSGNIGASNFFHQGTIDEVRFSNNVRYTANFAIPNASFINDGNTVALYHLDGCSNGLVPDASSNSNDGKPINLTGSCTFTLPVPPPIPVNAPAGNIQQAEYFYDTDPGFGNGTSITFSAAATVNLINQPVNTTGLTNGVHHMYVRTKNDKGDWGITNNTTFFILPPPATIPAVASATSVVKAEYFYDADPGFGNGTTIPVSGTFAVDVSTLSTGVHYIYVRTKDANGNWSITNMRSFYKLSGDIVIPAGTTASTITKAEYFIDTDPGFGNGKDIALTPGANLTISNALIDLTGLANGAHRVFVRTKDANGRWSITSNELFSIIAASFTIPSNPVPGNITRLEYFFDTDPGFGNGHIVSIAAPATNLTDYTINADVSALNDSVHTLYIRALDDWGITITRTFLKGSALPLTWLEFNATAGARDVLLNWKIANEINNDHFEIERSADGHTFTNIGSVADVAALQDYQFKDDHPLDGVNYYRIKQVDKNGRYDYSIIIAVRFGKDNRAITVYPDPANDMVHILFDKPQQKNSAVELINSSGQLIRSVTLDGSRSRDIIVSALPAGIYQLRFIINGNVSTTQKIIIQH